MTQDPGSGNPMRPYEPGQPNPPEPPAPAAGDDDSTSDLLQSMLSKAVGDQVGDQREIASAVSDIRGRLVRLSQELAEMRVRPPQDEATDAQINTVTVEMREAVRFLSERLDGVTRMVAQRGEEMADIRTALTAIDAHVRSQAETIGVLSSGLQALPSYGERVSVLQDNLQVLHRQLVGIEETLSAPAEDVQTGKRLSSIESAISPLAAKIEALSQAGGGNDELIAKIEALSQAGGNDELIAKIDALSQAGSDNGNAELMARLDALEDLTAGHQALLSRLDEVSEIGTAQSALLSQLQASTANVQQSVTDLHERVKPLASDVTAIGSGVTGLVEGSADGAALDARVTQSINAAMRDTEARLMAHVDEAVMALAETLLRQRRAVASATPLPTTPLVTHEEAPAVSSEVPAPLSAPPTTSVPVYQPATETPEPKTGAWWEQEAPTADATEVDAPPVEAEDAPVDQADADAPGDDAAQIAPSIPALDQTGPLPSEPPSGPPIEPAEAPGESAPPSSETPPAATGAPDGGDGWSPETPPERDPADPTVSMEEKKKRRWGRH